MTHATCPGCRLRFSRNAAATNTTCPFCSGPLTTGSARQAVGLRLIETFVFIDQRPVAPARPIPLHPRTGSRDV
jgi:hypothetical protein